MEDKKEYTNGEITVVWQPHVCIHSTLCWKQLKEVFNPRARPWVSMSGADSEAIEAQVAKCPSGALSSFRNAAQQEIPSVESASVVEVVSNGPLLVYGNIKIKDADGNEKKVLYKGHTGAFLDLAKKDWGLWNELRNKNSSDELVPKKYILIGHSMGGLTTRDYIMGPFYKGDVDKLVTLDSPHEGSGIANYVQYWHDSKNIMDHEWYTQAISGILTTLTVYDVATWCLNEPPTEWQKKLAIRSYLLAPLTWQQISSMIAMSQDQYSVNEDKTGLPYTQRGIEVMTLNEYQEGDRKPNDFL